MQPIRFRNLGHRIALFHNIEAVVGHSLLPPPLFLPSAAAIPAPAPIWWHAAFNNDRRLCICPGIAVAVVFEGSGGHRRRRRLVAAAATRAGTAIVWQVRKYLLLGFGHPRRRCGREAPARRILEPVREPPRQRDAELVPLVNTFDKPPPCRQRSRKISTGVCSHIIVVVVVVVVLTIITTADCRRRDSSSAPVAGTVARTRATAPT